MFLVVSNLSKNYDDGTEALKRINFKVSKGSFVALIGPSGSGKTTLIKCINSSITPTLGEIKLENVLISSPSTQALRKRSKIATIYQDFRLVEQITVLKNVLIGSLAYKKDFLNLFGVFDKFRIEEACSILKSLKIDDLRNKRIYQLSGGERQRVSIARAIMQKPSLLLADEPISSLDRKNAELVIRLIKNLSLKNEITVIFSTHNISLAKKYADETICLEEGRTRIYV